MDKIFKFIYSLGATDNVTNSINNYYETNNKYIFDDIIINFETILYYLNNINNIVTKNDFYDTTHKYTSHCQNCDK